MLIAPPQCGRLSQRTQSLNWLFDRFYIASALDSVSIAKTSQEILT